MIRIDRVVTKTGDGGETSLGDGTRVRKDAARVEAYGTVDEANALIGTIRPHVLEQPAVAAALLRIQNALFDLGADLCVPGRASVTAELADWLEGETAALNEALPPLESFVLPGGTPGATQAHVARTIVRRAERRVVSLAASEPVNPDVIRALNRLSDYLFVLARVLNTGQETLWTR